MQQTTEAWRTVFLIASGIYFTCTTVNLIFGKFEVQWWNSYWERELEDNNNNNNEKSVVVIEKIRDIDSDAVERKEEKMANGGAV